MLAYSRSGGSSDQVVRVEPVVKEVIKMLRSAMPATMEFHTEFATEIPMVRIDPVQLHQMVMNLCINARDAMGGRGQLQVRVERAQGLQAVCASCHHLVEGDFVDLKICDTGPGIGPDVLARIFEPFFTTKAVGSGTGMGLSVVHGILHEHGGHILVETGAEPGTCFRLLLPSLSAAVMEECCPGYASPVLRRGDGHVLVVDDETRLVSYYAELLEGQGYRVTGITDAREALLFFRSTPEDIDLVITDQTMPDMTGIQLAQALLAIRPELPVILCTGYSDEIDARSAKALQVAEYFQKPVLPADLINRVGELLQG
jgi:CheY-like chemotaxis protein